jgi:putative flippase GtrA
VILRESGWRSQFVRFLVVGFLNTLFGQCVFVTLVLFGCNDLLSLLIATVAGVIFNFHTVGRLVFQRKERSLLARFVLCYGLSYAVNAIALSSLTHFGLSSISAQAILVLPVASLTFMLVRSYVFSVGGSKA